MRVRFRIQAEEEFVSGRDWYEVREAGLGDEFRDSIDATIERIVQDPESFPIVWRGEVREILVRRFPYAVYFVVNAAEIVVLSIFHVRRNPAVWKRRHNK